jgi:hypothetical protein
VPVETLCSHAMKEHVTRARSARRPPARHHETEAEMVRNACDAYRREYLAHDEARLRVPCGLDEEASRTGLTAGASMPVSTPGHFSGSTCRKAQRKPIRAPPSRGILRWAFLLNLTLVATSATRWDISVDEAHSGADVGIAIADASPAAAIEVEIHLTQQEPAIS